MRYAAFLRGVSPMNAKMADLRAAFEAAGFGEVRTVISSGNVVFSARAASNASLQRKAEAAMYGHLGRTFLTIVRSVDFLREMLASDPLARFKVAPGAKRIVTFLREPPATAIRLPVEQGEARILSMTDGEVFSVHTPDPNGPNWMQLIERTFGKDQTSRTWETVTKVAT